MHQSFQNLGLVLQLNFSVRRQGEDRVFQGLARGQSQLGSHLQRFQQKVVDAFLLLLKQFLLSEKTIDEVHFIFCQVPKVLFASQQLDQHQPAPPDVLFVGPLVVVGLGSRESGLPKGPGNGRNSDAVGVSEPNQFEEETFAEGYQDDVFGIDSLVGVA